MLSKTPTSIKLFSTTAKTVLCVVQNTMVCLVNYNCSRIIILARANTSRQRERQSKRFLTIINFKTAGTNPEAIFLFYVFGILPKLR